MPSMKHTSCKLCGKNLDNYNYQYQEEHVKKCGLQKRLMDYT